MPNRAPATNNLGTSRAPRARKRAQRSARPTALKKAKGEGASADSQAIAVTLLDRAARKGLIHKNAAARHKSRLAKKAAKASA